MPLQSRLTPRTKGTQVAPDSTFISSPQGDLPREDGKIAPASIDPTKANDPIAATVTHVQQQVRYSGRQAFKDNILFYLRYLIPVTIVSVYLFGMYAAISCWVPNWMCEETAMELSVSGLMMMASLYLFCAYKTCSCTQTHTL